CSTAVTTRTVDGTPVDSTVMVTTRLDPPAGLAADEVIVYRQRAEVRSLLPGDASSPATTLRIVGHAWVGSYRVMLEQTPSDTNTSPREERDEFDALLRAAAGGVAAIQDSTRSRNSIDPAPGAAHLRGPLPRGSFPFERGLPTVPIARREQESSMRASTSGDRLGAPTNNQTNNPGEERR
ncbi:hypothetical protein B2J88_52260, partial [Rhodococcus sp. SRB_17]|nr:hypothetical protein [Rhodococcus sp. SRB_17]